MLLLHNIIKSFNFNKKYTNKMCNFSQIQCARELIAKSEGKRINC